MYRVDPLVSAFVGSYLHLASPFGRKFAQARKLAALYGFQGTF